MDTWTLAVMFLAVGSVTGLCWRYPLHLANAVRRGDIPEDQLDELVEVSGF